MNNNNNTKHLLTLTPAGAESDLKRYGGRRLPSIVLIKFRPSLAVFLLSSLRLSYLSRVAMVVGCSIAVPP